MRCDLVLSRILANTSRDWIMVQPEAQLVGGINSKSNKAPHRGKLRVQIHRRISRRKVLFRLR